MKVKTKYDTSMADSMIENELAELLDQLEVSTSCERLDAWYASPNSPENPDGPYPWQVDFHNAGEFAKERCAMAGNRTGKTRSLAAETAIHATGLYPSWWKGKRFDPRKDGPIEIWVGSETNEASRDITQKALLGGLGDLLGTGMIPKRCFEGLKPKMRQCGVNDVVDQIKVRHVDGSLSTIGFKTYDQGRLRWQGTSKHVVWCDEQPPIDVYTEGQLRTLDKGGCMILSFTPLKGVDDVVLKFLNKGVAEGVWCITASWDEAPHLSDEDKAQMLESMPENAREARTKGIPMVGQGLIFPFSDKSMVCEPFAIPDHFKQIDGIDFGINHPAAAVWLAIDVDNDIIYVTDCYKQAGEASAYHANRINSHSGSRWIPTAWPHDGMNREKSGGKTLADSYRQAGVKTMLPMSARYDDDKGGSQPIEPGLDEIYNRMRTGRFKVFAHLFEWFKEKNMYHRDDKLKVVDVRDDLMSATRYGVMMMRYAISKKQAGLLHNPLTSVADAGYDPTAMYD